MTSLGKTTVLADMEDINETKQLIEEQETSMNEQFDDVDTDMVALQKSITNNTDKISSLESEMANVKKSVSDGKTLVANAITNKGISTAVDAEFATMAANINNLSTIAGLTADATITSDLVLNGAIGYGKNGARIVGSMPNNAAVAAVLPVNGTYNIAAGYHNGQGTVKQNLALRGASTITPGTGNQVIGANQYLTGNQTILGDANLAAGNIRAGATIFGVAGNYNPISNAVMQYGTVGTTTVINATAGVGTTTGTITLNAGRYMYIHVSVTAGFSYGTIGAHVFEYWNSNTSLISSGVNSGTTRYNFNTETSISYVSSATLKLKLTLSGNIITITQICTNSGTNNPEISAVKVAVKYWYI